MYLTGRNRMGLERRTVLSIKENPAQESKDGNREENNDDNPHPPAKRFPICRGIVYDSPFLPGSMTGPSRSPSHNLSSIQTPFRQFLLHMQCTV